MSAAGVVLCGGLSSRMKRAKAWLPWHGRQREGVVLACNITKPGADGDHEIRLAQRFLVFCRIAETKVTRVER